MIESIKIENFQSHKESILNFSPGVNVIVGSSDCGKSAIIRAFNLVAFNRPLGTTFRSYWAKETTVTIKKPDFSIIRKKGKIDSYTIVKDKQKDPLILKAFGTKVPQEVTDTLNLSPINIQQQMDAPFLLKDSPGAVAAHFNKIAKLQIIDKASQNVDKWIREASAAITSNEKQLKEKKLELSQFKDIEKAEVRLEVLEGVITQRNTLSKNVARLRTLIAACIEINAKIELENSFLNVLPLYKAIKEKSEALKKKTKDIETLSILISKSKQTIKKIQICKSIISYEKHAKKIICIIKKKEALEKQNNAIKTLIKKIEVHNNSILAKRKRLKKDEMTLSKIMPNVCPLCETTLK